MIVLGCVGGWHVSQAGGKDGLAIPVSCSKRIKEHLVRGTAAVG